MGKRKRHYRTNPPNPFGSSVREGRSIPTDPSRALTAQGLLLLHPSPPFLFSLPTLPTLPSLLPPPPPFPPNTFCPGTTPSTCAWSSVRDPSTTTPSSGARARRWAFAPRFGRVNKAAPALSRIPSPPLGPSPPSPPPTLSLPVSPCSYPLPAPSFPTFAPHPPPLSTTTDPLGAG